MIYADICKQMLMLASACTAQLEVQWAYSGVRVNVLKKKNWSTEKQRNKQNNQPNMVHLKKVSGTGLIKS